MVLLAPEPYEMPFRAQCEDSAGHSKCSEGVLLTGAAYAGVLVEDAAEAHRQATAHGARSVLEPKVLEDEASSTEQVIAEVELYGDVVLRFVSGSFPVSHSPLPGHPHCFRHGAACKDPLQGGHAQSFILSSHRLHGGPKWKGVGVASILRR